MATPELGHYTKTQKTLHIYIYIYIYIYTVYIYIYTYTGSRCQKGCHVQMYVST